MIKEKIPGYISKHLKSKCEIKSVKSERNKKLLYNENKILTENAENEMFKRKSNE